MLDIYEIMYIYSFMAVAYFDFVISDTICKVSTDFYTCVHTKTITQQGILKQGLC